MPLIATTPWVLPAAGLHAGVNAALAEIHAPHLPSLIEITDGDHLAAPTSQLVGLHPLPIELRSYGWQLARPGARNITAEQTLAASRIQSRLQATADSAGESGIELDRIAIDVIGPISQWAQLWLPSGQRALRDHGARAELVESWIQAMHTLTDSVASSLGAALSLRIHEPYLEDIVAGAIPTASGHRTERAIDPAELRQVWQQVLTELADSTALIFGTQQAGTGKISRRIIDEVTELLAKHDPETGHGLILPLFDISAPAAASAARLGYWENIEAFLKSGFHIQWRLDEAVFQQGELGVVGDRTVEVFSDIGLDPQLLNNCVLEPTGLAQLSLREALARLEYTRNLAEHLTGVVATLG